MLRLDEIKPGVKCEYTSWGAVNNPSRKALWCGCEIITVWKGKVVLVTAKGHPHIHDPKTHAFRKVSK